MFTKACDCALHTNRSRQQALALKFWLQLVLAVSYHRDGQEQILAIDDILDYLCDLYEHSEGIWSIINKILSNNILLTKT